MCDLLGMHRHYLGRFTLGKTIYLCDYGIGNQTMTVVAQGVPHIAQFTGRIAFAVQPRIGTCGGLVGIVTAALTFEVTIVIIAAVFGFEALVAQPSLNQRGIHAKVLA